MHPEDAAALRQLENIPGFPALVKKVLSLGYEQMQYGTNMASNIRLSPTQLPEIYNHLPPICKKLGIDEPEFYLQMTPMRGHSATARFSSPSPPDSWSFSTTKNSMQ